MYIKKHKDCKMKSVTILFFILTSVSLSQSISFTGKILNLKTGKPIPYVNIGVEGTYYGTSSNELGKFKIRLKKGTHNLIISCVGYKTEKSTITVPDKKNLLIKLKPIPIKLPEVIVNAKENPAYEIIRKAIANKEKNKKGLFNYRYDFYSKNILKSGKEITLIEEDIGEGFNDLQKGIKELKTEIHHTENVSKKFFEFGDMNFLEKKIIDFTDDSLKLGKFIFHLPLSKFAFDYYDYKLIGLQQNNNKILYKIEVIPLSKIRPTFKGTLFIEDSSYALVKLNLKLANRNLMPFTDFKMSIVQNLTKLKNYWLPQYYNIDLDLNFNYYYLFGLDSLITSYVKVFNNQTININRNDSALANINLLIKKDSLVANYRKNYKRFSGNLTKQDSLKKIITGVDSLYKVTPKTITKAEIDSLRLYPLSLDEIKAYQNIDSTKNIVSSFKLTGVFGKYAKSKGLVSSDLDRNKKKKPAKLSLGKIFRYLNFQNNRVDGILLGLKYSDWITKNINVSTNAGYTLGSKTIQTDFSFYSSIKNSFISGIELTGNFGTKPMYVFSHYKNFFHYKNLLNSIAVTLGAEDQFSYYHSKGGSIKIEKNFAKNISAKIGFTLEYQKQIKALKYQSIFNSGRYVRPNPKIIEGTDNRMVLTFNAGKSPYKLNFNTSNGFIADVELSSKFFGSKFNYVKTTLAYQFFIKTMYNELFFSPYLAVFLETGIVTGSFGPQHLYTPQSALSVYSPLGTFKGLQPYQLIGNKIISVHLEHNWRKTFFDMLGIYFPVAWNLELTTGINGLRIWNDSNFIKDIQSNDYYWEVYGGLSGILGIININIAYNKYKDTVLRFGFSKFF